MSPYREMAAIREKAIEVDPDAVTTAEILALRWCKESGYVHEVRFSSWGCHIDLMVKKGGMQQTFYGRTLLEAVWQMWECIG